VNCVTVIRPDGEAQGPSIAALEGDVTGDDLEAALACDLLVAARDARLGMPEVRRGAVAKGLVRMSRALAHHVAMELALTGGFIGAQRAYELGLINRLTDPDGAVDEARALAAAIGRNGPIALESTKQIVLRARDHSDADAFEMQEEFVAAVRSSEDALEGARAFAEKRDPVWKGR
jgi:enoyl-CoA hydratase